MTKPLAQLPEGLVSADIAESSVSIKLDSTVYPLQAIYGADFAVAPLSVVVDPVRAFLAFSFSHAVEYMVFVWAFQRRRYAAPLPHDRGCPPRR